MAVIKTPFSITNNGKIAVEKTVESIVSQKINDYLLTQQLERPMSPLYGAETQYLLFENFDSLVFEEYKVETMREINKHISEAQVVNMVLRENQGDGFAYDEEPTFKINVQYRLPAGELNQAQVSVVSPLSLTEASRL